MQHALGKVAKKQIFGKRLVFFHTKKNPSLVFLTGKNVTPIFPSEIRPLLGETEEELHILAYYRLMLCILATLAALHSTPLTLWAGGSQFRTRSSFEASELVALLWFGLNTSLQNRYLSVDQSLKFPFNWFFSKFLPSGPICNHGCSNFNFYFSYCKAQNSGTRLGD